MILGDFWRVFAFAIGIAKQSSSTRASSVLCWSGARARYPRAERA